MSLPTLDDVLEDIEARFLYNLREAELMSPDRLFFQIEQAHWYYEDFKADLHSHLPHFKKLKSFALVIFKHCPLLSKMEDKCNELFTHFTQYKSKIPVYGCIILNSKMNKTILVSDYSSKSWMFPRGKINENESELNCAIREVNEEIGYDVTSHCQEEDHLVDFQDNKMIKLFIACNVSESVTFECQTRKEIADISWFNLDNLPKATYGVYNFLPKLKRWIQQRRKELCKSPITTSNQSSRPDLLLKKQKSCKVIPLAGSVTPIRSNSKISASPLGKKSSINQFDKRNGETFDQMNSAPGWGVAEMFQANALLTGKNYQYTGNPHEFGSTHPRYVNYIHPSDGIQSSIRSFHAMDSSSSQSLLFPNEVNPFEELSQQTIRSQSLMFKDRHNSEGSIESMIDLILPAVAVSHSTTEYQWTRPQFFPHSSQIFDCSDIMATVRSVLEVT